MWYGRYDDSDLAPALPKPCACDNGPPSIPPDVAMALWAGNDEPSMTIWAQPDPYEGQWHTGHPRAEYLFLPTASKEEKELEQAIFNALDAGLDAMFLLKATQDVVQKWARAHVIKGERLADWERHVSSDQ